MALETTGKLIEIYPTQEINDRFKKREFVVEVGENAQYPNYAKFQLVQNKCEDINAFKVGDMVKISFDIRGGKWEKDGRVNYITNLQAWRIESLAGSPAATPNKFEDPDFSAPAQQNSAPSSSSFDSLGGGDFDDLPF